MRLLFARFFVLSSMDVLAEEFGNLTPEQLAAPIPTVEVRGGHAGSGRGRDVSPERRCPQSSGRARGAGRGFCACPALSARSEIHARSRHCWHMEGASPGETSAATEVERPSAPLSIWALLVFPRCQGRTALTALEDVSHLCGLIKDDEFQGA